MSGDPESSCNTFTILYGKDCIDIVKQRSSSHSNIPILVRLALSFGKKNSGFLRVDRLDVKNVK